MRTSSRLALAFGLALSMSSVAASAAQAQGRSPADARLVENHRLTMPVLRKVLPALAAPGAQSCARDSRTGERIIGFAWAESLRRTTDALRALLGN